jgi:prophage regulatory protein
MGPHQQSQEALIRLPQVLSRFPVSRSTWYSGVKRGLYPKPIKAGPRTAMWRAADVDRLILSLSK